MAGVLRSFFGVETVGRIIMNIDALFKFPSPPKVSQKRAKPVKDERIELSVKMADLEGRGSQRRIISETLIQTAKTTPQ